MGSVPHVNFLRVKNRKHESQHEVEIGLQLLQKCLFDFHLDSLFYKLVMCTYHFDLIFLVWYFILIRRHILLRIIQQPGSEHEFRLCGTIPKSKINVLTSLKTWPTAFFKAYIT